MCNLPKKNINRTRRKREEFKKKRGKHKIGN